jgi:hypothetical protein
MKDMSVDAVDAGSDSDCGTASVVLGSWPACALVSSSTVTVVSGTCNID